MKSTNGYTAVKTEEDVKKGDITPFDVGRGSLVSNQERNSDYADNLSSEDLKKINEGLKLLKKLEELTGPAIDPKDQQLMRNAFQSVATLALVDEIPYWLFQYLATYEGLIKMGLEPVSANILAVILSGIDFLANITNVSPANDANDVLFATRKPLAYLNGLLLLIKGISIGGSYTFGASAGLTAMLQFKAKGFDGLTGLSDTNFNIAAIALGAVTILPGILYYLGFNNAGIHKTFLAIEAWLAAPQSDLNPSRIVEAIKKSTGITLYRAIGFAFIAQSLLPALRLTGTDIDNTSYAFAGLALISTALNVVFARLLPTVSALLNSDNTHVLPSEFDDATQQYKNNAFTATDLFNLMANLAIAAGWGMILNTFTNNATLKWALTFVVPVLVAANSIYAQRNAAIYTQALENIHEADNCQIIALSATKPALKDLGRGKLVIQWSEKEPNQAFAYWSNGTEMTEKPLVMEKLPDRLLARLGKGPLDKEKEDDVDLIQQTATIVDYKQDEIKLRVTTMKN